MMHIVIEIMSDLHNTLGLRHTISSANGMGINETIQQKLILLCRHIRMRKVMDLPQIKH